MTLMSRINRISAWVLLFSILIYVITGFDILGRFLSPQLSSVIHLKYLFLPAEVAFAFHSSYAMNQAFHRWKFKKWMISGTLTAFNALNAACLLYYCYLEFYRQ